MSTNAGPRPSGGDPAAGILSWLLGATAAWFSAAAVARPSTPVDAALPFIAVAIVVLALMSRPHVAFGVPLLLAASVAIDAEAPRLLAFGAVFAASFTCAIALAESRKKIGAARAFGFAILAIAMLRWIPANDLPWGREALLGFLGASTGAILGGGPVAIAAGVATAFFTPAVPMRTLVLPLLVFAAALALRIAGVARPRLTIVGVTVLAPLLVFFPWSGVAARALPLVFEGIPLQTSSRIEVRHAVVPGAETILPVPRDATAILVSGSGVSGLRRGTVVGRLEPGGMPIVIGDIADRDFLRLEGFYPPRNPIPRESGGTLEGYGYRAFVTGSGRIALPADAAFIRVIADASLPRGAALQVDGFELERR